jgi:nicotinate-nucleotide adenylyltransferase
MRVGLLGGSFNPAHAGHLHIARLALRRLRLDQVWLLVSPGNPLKPVAGMARLADRLASARAIADGRLVVATAVEARLGTRYTADTLAALRRRFPRARFVWLMGADNLEQLPRWNRWAAIGRGSAFAVFPRPSYNHRALAGQAARRLRQARRASHLAPALAGMARPGWVFLPAPQHTASATAIRAAATRPAATESAPPPTDSVPITDPVSSPAPGVSDHRPQAARAAVAA